MSPSSTAELLPFDLRNRSFRGLDCEGWDFTGRDIRGCDFIKAKLKGANFSQVIAGRSRKQNLVTVAGVVIGSVAGSVVGVVAITGVVKDIVAGIVAGTGTNATELLVLSALIGAVAIAGAVAAIVMLTVVLAVVFSTGSHANTSEGITEPFAVAFAVSGAISSVFAASRAIEDFNKGQTPAAVFWSVLAVLLLVFAFLSAREAVQHLEESTGTDFRVADLQGVNFSHATLSNCNFARANVRFVNWSHVKGDRSTINFASARMQLLISRSGTNAMYVERDLSDCHLAEIDLVKANLQGSDLTRSNLQHADLTFANLTNVKAGGTDFRHANLTGSCIQNWTINGETQFNNLICDFIYLTPDHDSQNRRPLSGSFEPGDFEKLVGKFADTIDFILRQGTDPIVFRQALNQVIQDNPNVNLKSIERLGSDDVLIQATASDGADKVKLYDNFLDNQAKLQSAQQEIYHLNTRVGDRDKTIGMMERLLLAAQERPHTTNIVQQAKTIGDLMPNKSNQYKSGGDINIAQGKSAINTGTGVAAGGDISGTLNLNLAALKETEDPKAKELVELISQLRQAIEAPDSDLDDRFKQRALSYLDNLTKLAKEQPEDRLKQAKENIEDLTDIAEKGSKLAKFAKDYFPTVTAAITGIRLWFGV
jgi:uncharacterized protein YjbI with pentapeptide repeats